MMLITVTRVKLGFGALMITSHPMTDKVINKILSDAQEIIAQEKEALARGKDLDELQIDKSLLLRPLPKVENDAESVEERQNKLAMASVVMQAKGVNSVHKAVKTYKEQQSGSFDNDAKSKACTIL